MSLNPKHLDLYRKIAWLFVRHARPAILEQTDFASQAEEDADGGGSEPEDFVARLEKMGPTFVKLGQLLSTRGDLMPPRYTEALERLQDDVDPLPYDTIREVVERELKVRISKAFASFDETPIAAASLGQVHRGKLRDGREVVVKVQRPNVRQKIKRDLDALSEIAEYADEHTELGQLYRFGGIIEQFRRSIVDELDYELEARNLKTLATELAEFRKLIVPEPVEGFCSDKVLVMDYVEGVKVTDLSGVTRTELDGPVLAEEVFRAYLRQVLVLGFYHSDPHPGNVLVTPDHRVCLIDLGMVGRLSDGMRDQLFSLLSAISENDSDRVTDIAKRIAGAGNPAFAGPEFTAEITELVGRTSGANVKELRFGSVVMDIMRICAKHDLRIPREMSMLGKTLLNLDKVALSLDPDFNPNDCIRESLAEIAQQRSWNNLKRGDFMGLLLEIKELLAKSPQRINDVLEILAENRLRLDVDAVDETALIKGFQKIANRIAMGAIIGALVVGASFMMDIETDFMIGEYPGLPMLMLLVAGCFGGTFLYSILRHDQ